MRYLAAVIGLIGLVGAPALAQAASPDSVVKSPTADLNALVKQLGSKTPYEAQAAEIRLARIPLEDFPLVETALKTADLNDAARDRLRRLIERQRPWMEARFRQDKINRAEQFWNVQDALAAYEKFGSHNPAWDTQARDAIAFSMPAFTHQRRSLSMYWWVHYDVNAATASLAVVGKAKCEDPFILYLQGYLTEMINPDKIGDITSHYITAIRGMNHHNYPGFRMFEAMVQSDNEVTRLDEWHNWGQMPPEAQKMADGRVMFMGQAWEKALGENVPPGLLMWPAYAALRNQKDARRRKLVFDALYPALKKAMPDSSIPPTFLGVYSVQAAWDARGSGRANTVAPQGWDGFKKNLAEAEKALTAAWEKDHDDWMASTEMITVEMGQGQGRLRMEQWFSRAMEADPDNYRTCFTKLGYLDPKWHGTLADVVQFGHECYEGQNWRGSIPFILIDAHEKAAKTEQDPRAYYSRPEVWKEIQDVYEPYLMAYPEDHFQRSRYAQFAVFAGHPEVAKKQFGRLGGRAVSEACGGTMQLKALINEAMNGL